MSEENKGETVITASLICKEVKVQLIGASGQPEPYVLRELGGTDRDRYIDEMAQRAKYTPDGKPVGLRSYLGIQSRLISLCLFDKGNNPVPIQTISTWPSSAINVLFNKAREISGLGDEGEVQAKNA